MKQYYNILGVREGASKVEIKRAYRKLVMRYHPDRNPDPNAAAVFAKIQEAYEIVYHHNPSTSSSSQTFAGYQSTSTQQARSRRTAQQAKAAQRRKAQHIWKQHVLDELYYRKLTSGWRWTYFRTGAIIGLVVSCILILEYFLPAHYSKDQFVTYSKEQFNGFRGGRVHLVGLNDQGKFWVEGGTYYYLARHPQCFVEKSWFFHIPRKIIHPIDRGIERYPIEFGMRAFFPFSLIVFGFPFLVMYRRKKNTAFSILYHFSFYLMIPLILFFVFTADRWAHILTFGFL